MPKPNGPSILYIAAEYRLAEVREKKHEFDLYFEIFPFAELPDGAEGFDLGCGSGRWAELVRERVGLLHCIDPSDKALAVAKERLDCERNVAFHLASVDSIPLPDSSQDFGYSLGVLHHVPYPEEGLKACVAKLKPGAPFLLYLYYAPLVQGRLGDHGCDQERGLALPVRASKDDDHCDRRRSLLAARQAGEDCRRAWGRERRISPVGVQVQQLLYDANGLVGSVRD